MSELTANGYQLDTYAEIWAEVTASIRARPGCAGLTFGSDTIEGQILAAVCQKFAAVDSSVGAAYHGTDPLNAVEAAAYGLARLRGTNPRAATSATVRCTVNVNTGTYVAGALVAYQASNPNNQWTNVRDVVAAATGNVSDVLFAAREAGSGSSVLAGELTGKVSAAGWNSVTNPLDSARGTDAETARQTLLRSEINYYRQAAHSLKAVRAAVASVPGVVDALVTPGAGTVTVTVWDGTTLAAEDSEIAAAIWDVLAPGIGTLGGTEDLSVGYSVKFDRAEAVNLYLELDLKGVSVSVADAKAALIAAMPGANGEGGLGGTVRVAKLIQAALSVTGVQDVVALRLSLNADPITGEDTNITVGAAEWPVLDSGNITIGVTP